MALVGCTATSGNSKIKDHTQDTVDQTIVVGKTTKADVKADLGEPTAITLNDNGSENWTYVFSNATAKGVSYVPIVNLFARGADVNTKKVIILFDKKGVVQKAVFSENQSEHMSGIGAK